MNRDTTNNPLHDPVLLAEAVEHLVTNPEGRYVDCTGGLGGHSRAILENLGTQAELWISDYHKPTAEALEQSFKQEKRAHVVCARFSSIFDNLVPPFSGILADFGISSPQLEDPDIGIGFQIDGPLDMRIDETLTQTAADLLKTASQEELADIFFFYGGERASRKMAAAIVMDRKNQKFYDTTTELGGLCERVLGKFYFKKKIHPATKIFQALRIAVNRELDEVDILLEKAPYALEVGGRLVLISFHEGEDRKVKKKFLELQQMGDFKRITRKAIKPSDEEIERNPRSRSARMRVLERVS